MKPTITEKGVIEEFRNLVNIEGKHLDPSDELDWYSLSIGYIIGKMPGMPNDRVVELACYMRYTLEIG